MHRQRHEKRLGANPKLNLEGPIQASRLRPQGQTDSAPSITIRKPRDRAAGNRLAEGVLPR